MNCVQHPLMIVIIVDRSGGSGLLFYNTDCSLMMNESSDGIVGRKKERRWVVRSRVSVSGELAVHRRLGEEWDLLLFWFESLLLAGLLAGDKSRHTSCAPGYIGNGISV